MAGFFLARPRFQKKFVENMKTRIACPITFSSDNPNFYAIRWGKKRGTGQITDDNNLIIWRIRIACWITKVRNTQSGYIITSVYPPQQFLHERTSMIPYSCTACLCV